MSTCKSSTAMGTLAKKTVDWMEVPDKELVTDLDNMDLKEAEAEQKQKQEAKEMKQAAAAEARKWQWADSEAQASRSWTNMSICIRCTRLRLTCSIPVGVKKRSAYGSCAKAKERCGEHKKWAKKAAGDNNDNNKIVILSGWKIKWQGGVSSCMDVANSHLEKIVSMSQSNGQKMQQHFLLMEGLVGQQQMLVSKLVEMSGAAGSRGVKEVAKGQEEPKELQGGESGGQEDETEDVLGEGPEGVPENGPGDGSGVEDGTEENPQEKTQGKGKERAI
ncbi:hypothetical protein ID866_9225 [Astraeus odoratus]|nr:hypothetical protein ID866_9225 [Astraeus odoratus]